MRKNAQKIVPVVILVVLVCSLISGCEFGVNNENSVEERTYKNITYDIAYSASKKDGLRSRVYYHFLFSESDGKVLKCVHTTAGNGRTTVLEGIFEGLLDKQVTITFDSEDSGKVYYFENGHMRSEDGKEVYSLSSIEEAIYKINLWQ